MSMSRTVTLILAPAATALAVTGAVAAGPALSAASAETPVPPGSPGDTNHNGLLDSSERPDNPDA